MLFIFLRVELGTKKSQILCPEELLHSAEDVSSKSILPFLRLSDRLTET